MNHGNGNAIRNIRVMSCGARYGEPPQGADFLLDCRGFANPHYEPELRPLTGASAKVRAFFEAQPDVQDALKALEAMLKALLPGLMTRSAYHRERPILLVFMCTGGKHRSRYFAIEAARMVSSLVDANPDWGSVSVHLKHRDRVASH